MSDITFLAGEAGRIDKVIGGEPAVSNSLQGFSRSQAGSYIERGHVLLNGKPAKKSNMVKIGDEITLTILHHGGEITSLAGSLNILFEDEHLIVLDKPAGLVVHPGAGNPDNTLVNLLAYHYQQGGGSLPPVFNGTHEERAGIAHRLDKQTSGVMVVAKTLESLQSLQKQFQQRSIERQYVALCLATPRSRTELGKSQSGCIEGILRRKSTDRKTFELVKETGRGRFSKTFWTVVERFMFGMLVECRLATGRTHQIRVHLAANGNPVAGDPVYKVEGAYLPKALQLATEKFGRQALHAETLGFVHPVRGNHVTFKSAPPEEMLELIQLYRSWKGGT